jgi:energy-coupling factor transporter ATP-binding protein EcfA2
MSRGFSRLTVRSFRGATHPVSISLDTTRPLVVLFGENGCGKSCLVDAIDFAANESMGSLELRRGIGTKSQYIASIDGQAADIRVELETADGCSRTASLVRGKVKVSGKGVLPAVRILRRAEILALVETEPSIRYEALSKFVSVDEYETGETRLREACKATTEAYNSAAVRLEGAERRLEEYWQAEDRPGESALAWASERAKADVRRLAETERQLKALGTSVRSHQEKRRALAGALRGKHCAERELRKLEASIAQAPPIEGSDAVALVALLQRAGALVGDGAALERCPMCLQTTRGTELAASIRERLAQMDAHVKLLSGYEGARSLRQLAAARTAEAEGELGASVGTLCAAATAARDTLDDRPRQALERLVEAQAEGEPAGVRRYAKALARGLVCVEEELGRVKDDLAKHNGIAIQYREMVQAAKDAEANEGLSERLQNALEILETTRKTYVEWVLASVADDCQRLYERIHPDETLGSPRLTIIEKRRRSIDLTAEFGGRQEVPPQGYFSESHLDTLGFCIWLALARREDPQNTVLVLDDIFTSVDAQHLSRLVALIDETAQEFAQVIVTTHYRNWRDRYLFAQAPGMRAQLLELQRWTLERGVRLSGTSLAVDELERRLAAESLDRQAVASQAGTVFEAALDSLTLVYRCRLPRSHGGEWTIGELLDSCKHLLQNLEIEADATSSLGRAGPGARSALAAAVSPFYQDAGWVSFARSGNGRHFGCAREEASDADVVAFGKAAAALARALTCESCGQVPSTRKGDHFACGCGKTKMKPLEFMG